MNTLSKEQASYIAGWVDADGSIIAQIVQRKDYVLQYQIRVSVLFGQKICRQDYLELFKDEIGAGTLRDRRDGMGELAVVGRDDVSELLIQIVPYLRNKKKQAEIVLNICKRLPEVNNDPYKFLELCKLSDEVASYNDSRNRIHTTNSVKQKFKSLRIIQN